MDNNRIIIIAVVLVVVLVGLAFIFVHPQPNGVSTGGSSQTTGGAGANAGGGNTPAPAPTRETLLGNVTVPKLGQTVASSVAAPQAVSPANSHTTSQYRSFTIQAKNNEFTPSTIIVNQGDIVNIIVDAVDKDYDFTQPDYGFHQTIPEGTTKAIQFGATASGKFTFYCSSCGGPAAGPMGYIEVVAK
jgi:hypothetical protein